ncbi:retropepsin-like aspartic protease [Dyadobacter pollutisoli]|uniref:Retropepsin-like aspartic protease n=1 Tax=Dyadobacter pollutisoli TaxID=2910158 RepID=A0A9E8NB89_9BACT|nr:retropepsin-like aspartic protease [Dyadobacter pollutisoli]WAC13459.1 retropepsin-like aspartic protease [Dyadobacter pollutisoli]
MKSSILIFVVFFVCCKQKVAVEDYSSIEQTLQILVQKGEYFKLKTDVHKYEAILPANNLHFYQAFIESAFNNCPKSILLIKSLLKNDNTSLKDSARIDLMLLLRDNYFKTFQYKQAAEVGKDIVKNYKNVLGDRLHDVENTLLIHEGLKDIPLQQVDLKKVTLKWKPNKLGLIEIPLKTKTSTQGIVFDTRAHISTVTQSFAKKLGLKILDVSFQESSGITGIKFQSGLGVADSLYLGDILIKNAVFQVLPDEQLHFPSLNYTLDGILGFPVITQLKEVHIRRNGDFVISPNPTHSNLNNLAFDGSTTVISVKNDSDTLSFHFDSGATASEFYSNYFNRYKTEITKKGKTQTVESGGVGGSIKIQVYILPTINLAIGEKELQLKEIAVRTVPTFINQKYNGNIGQDVINQFDEMILNFDSMYLNFK